MENNSKNEAAKLLKKYSAIGSDKNSEPNKIRSLGTLRSYCQCIKQYLEWRLVNNLPKESQDRKIDLVKYLEEMSEWHKQKTVDQHRMSLCKAFNKKIPKVKAKCVTLLSSRIYTAYEVSKINALLSEKYQISVLLCFLCGLRAHELATLRRYDERERSNGRMWRADLFKHLIDYKKYTVVGKGGLIRYVAVPNFLAEKLESTRLTFSKKIIDRGIVYFSYYDIGCGQTISQCFGNASKTALGFSKGLHGLRHSYAQNRIKMFLRLGESFDTARAVVSQELGHFRPNITNCYLR